MMMRKVTIKKTPKGNPPLNLLKKTKTKSQRIKKKAIKGRLIDDKLIGEFDIKDFADLCRGVEHEYNRLKREFPQKSE